jgi:hypothetical protein
MATLKSERLEDTNELALASASASTPSHYIDIIQASGFASLIFKLNIKENHSSIRCRRLKPICTKGQGKRYKEREREREREKLNARENEREKPTDNKIHLQFCRKSIKIIQNSEIREKHIKLKKK